MNKRAIIVIGPQGSGKGTQAKLLAQKIKAPVIETGAVLRQEKSSPTALGKTIGKYIDEGRLVPLKILRRVLRPVIKSTSKHKVILLDGVPRSLHQKNFIESELSKYNFDERLVLCFVLNDKISIERLKLRAREDDTAEKITTRLKIYHSKTDPLIKYFESNQSYKVIKIDASQPIPAIEKQVHKAYQDITNAN